MIPILKIVSQKGCKYERKITGVKVDSKLFYLNRWKEEVTIYQDTDSYGRSSTFGRKTMVSIVYTLSLRYIVD